VAVNRGSALTWRVSGAHRPARPLRPPGWGHRAQLADVITIVDLAWGTFLSAAVAGIATFAMLRLA
jgi:hypothetical protein